VSGGNVSPDGRWVWTGTGWTPNLIQESGPMPAMALPEVVPHSMPPMSQPPPNNSEPEKVNIWTIRAFAISVLLFGFAATFGLEEPGEPRDGEIVFTVMNFLAPLFYIICVYFGGKMSKGTIRAILLFPYTLLNRIRHTLNKSESSRTIEGRVTPKRNYNLYIGTIVFVPVILRITSQLLSLPDLFVATTLIIDVEAIFLWYIMGFIFVRKGGMSADFMITLAPWIGIICMFISFFMAIDMIYLIVPALNDNYVPPISITANFFDIGLIVNGLTIIRDNDSN